MAALLVDRQQQLAELAELIQNDAQAADTSSAIESPDAITFALFASAPKAARSSATGSTTRR